MFDQDQKRTLRIALLAIVVGFLLSMFGGCDGSGTTEPAQTDAGSHSDSLVPTTNPCGTAPGCTLTTCGWDVATGKCYDTIWCEPSVVSVLPNPYEGSRATPIKNAIYERPASAVCPAGATRYVYQPGQLMVCPSCGRCTDMDFHPCSGGGGLFNSPTRCRLTPPTQYRTGSRSSPAPDPSDRPSTASYRDKYSLSTG